LHSESSRFLISVIIPTLNEEKLISQALSQFTPELKDKYKIEVIVSDGGSTDSTVKKAESFADVVFRADPNLPQNIPIGRNLGAKKASGKYLYFINADTKIEDAEFFFRKTLSAIENPSTAALTMKIKVFPAEEKFSDKLFHGFYNTYVFLLNSIGMGMGRGECQIVKKEYFIQIGGYDENLPAGEDFDLYKRLKKLGKIKFLTNLVVYESPRRYRKYGYPKVFWEWTINSISVFFRHKSVSDRWEPVR
jgi:glycosyltransferase involved in cell wall biosynthesis